MLIDDNLLDTLIDQAKVAERLRKNRDLRNSDRDGSQRMLNALEVGTPLPIHRHTRTSETQILLRGKLDVVFYNDLGRETDRFHLDPQKGKYGVDIPIGCWHTIEVIVPSVIFEVKDGSYSSLSPEDILY